MECRGGLQQQHEHYSTCLIAKRPPASLSRTRTIVFTCHLPPKGAGTFRVFNSGSPTMRETGKLREHRPQLLGGLCSRDLFGISVPQLHAVCGSQSMPREGTAASPVSLSHGLTSSLAWVRPPEVPHACAADQSPGFMLEIRVNAAFADAHAVTSLCRERPRRRKANSAIINAPKLNESRRQGLKTAAEAHSPELGSK